MLICFALKMCSIAVAPLLFESASLRRTSRNGRKRNRGRASKSEGQRERESMRRKLYACIANGLLCYFKDMLPLLLLLSVFVFSARIHTESKSARFADERYAVAYCFPYSILHVELRDIFFLIYIFHRIYSVCQFSLPSHCIHIHVLFALNLFVCSFLLRLRCSVARALLTFLCDSCSCSDCFRECVCQCQYFQPKNSNERPPNGMGDLNIVVLIAD